jgi:hypothetical protein
MTLAAMNIDSNIPAGISKEAYIKFTHPESYIPSNHTAKLCCEWGSFPV